MDDETALADATSPEDLADEAEDDVIAGKKKGDDDNGIIAVLIG